MLAHHLMSFAQFETIATNIDYQLTHCDILINESPNYFAK
jgi:hypothetical protein